MSKVKELLFTDIADMAEAKAFRPNDGHKKPDYGPEVVSLAKYLLEKGYETNQVHRELFNYIQGSQKAKENAFFKLMELHIDKSISDFKKKGGTSEL